MHFFYFERGLCILCAVFQSRPKFRLKDKQMSNWNQRDSVGLVRSLLDGNQSSSKCFRPFMEFSGKIEVPGSSLKGRSTATEIKPAPILVACDHPSLWTVLAYRHETGREWINNKSRKKIIKWRRRRKKTTTKWATVDGGGYGPTLAVVAPPSISTGKWKQNTHRVAETKRK